MLQVEVKESLGTAKELDMPISAVTIQKAYRIHLCWNCGLTIFEGEDHYAVYEHPNQKSPHRYHIGCLGGF